MHPTQEIRWGRPLESYKSKEKGKKLHQYSTTISFKNSVGNQREGLCFSREHDWTLMQQLQHSRKTQKKKEAPCD